MSRSNPIEYNGVTYESGNALARAYGVNCRLFHNRLRYGWTVEEALQGRGNYKRNYKKGTVDYTVKKVEYKGVMYESISALARTYNIRPKLFRKRLNYGWTVEEVIQGHRFQRNERNEKNGIEYKGVWYKNKKELAKAYNINYEVFIIRITKMGCSIEEAIEYKPKNIKPIECNGIKYESIVALANAYDISESVVRTRLCAGWTAEQAVKLKPTSYGEQVICYTLKANNMKFVHNMGLTYLSKNFSNIDFDKIDEKIKNKDIGFKYYTERKKYILLRPDFCLFDNDKILAIIEYNGGQHYAPLYLTAERFERRCEGDKFKEFVSNTMGIPFFVIDEKRKGNLCDEEYVVSELMNIIHIVRNING